jgi:hypothetical protein
MRSRGVICQRDDLRGEGPGWGWSNYGFKARNGFSIWTPPVLEILREQALAFGDGRALEDQRVPKREAGEPVEIDGAEEVVESDDHDLQPSEAVTECKYDCVWYY